MTLDDAIGIAVVLAALVIGWSMYAALDVGDERHARDVGPDTTWTVNGQ